MGFGAEAHGNRADLDATRGNGKRERQRAEVGAGAERAGTRGVGAEQGGAGVVLEDDEREAGGEDEGGGEFE